MTDVLLAMRGVRKAFRFFALDDLTLEVEPGQIVGFVGPNGAGKSTTLRLAMGFLTADAGEIRLLGRPMPEEQAAAKRDVGYVSAEMRLFPHATIGWHLELARSIYPDWDAAYAAALVERFDLKLAQKAHGLSQGEQVKAALTLALAHRPRLLLLDEPTTGLDPVARHEVISELMDVLRDENRSIVFSSHNTVDVERIADRIVFIDRGRVVEDREKHDFLDRWRRIHLQLPPDTSLPALPEVVSRVSDGRFVTLVTNDYTDRLQTLLGAHVRDVQRMSLEEIFVATVMHHRESRRR